MPRSWPASFLPHLRLHGIPDAPLHGHHSIPVPSFKFSVAPPAAWRLATHPQAGFLRSQRQLSKTPPVSASTMLDGSGTAWIERSSIAKSPPTSAVVALRSSMTTDVADPEFHASANGTQIAVVD